MILRIRPDLVPEATLLMRLLAAHGIPIPTIPGAPSQRQWRGPTVSPEPQGRRTPDRICSRPGEQGQAAPITSPEGRAVPAFPSED